MKTAAGEMTHNVWTVTIDALALHIHDRYEKGAEWVLQNGDK